MAYCSNDPDAPEFCDAANVDENCNGLADDADPLVGGTVAFFADSDGDGFGNAAVSLQRCDVDAGFVTDATDCDDTNISINPDALDDPALPEDANCDGSP